MAIIVKAAKLTPNPVTVSKSCIISVTLSTWDYLKATYTWSNLKSSGQTWDVLRK